MTPLKRFTNLLKLDRRDVYQILFYAAFAGLISLSLPLGIQAIINFIQSAQVSASWIILIIVVTAGASLVGILSLMQLRITENLQQKIFVRASFEFAYRLPKIRFRDMYNNYPPEVANRFFDTLSVQKGTSKMLLDFSSAFLQIGFGIILLSFYHPFFILFGLLLVMLLYFIFKYSFTPGLETSLKESKFKYKVAYWLQEMARNNNSFRKRQNFEYALERNNILAGEYVDFREKHFGVIRRQYIQLIIFKTIITAGLLSIGGYLVMSQQMNIGQFVAAEIVILLVINSVEKLIMGLETFYDVLTSVEKIGYVTDMEIEQPSREETVSYQAITLETEKVNFRFPDTRKRALKDITLTIAQGEKIFVSGGNGSGKSTLIRFLAGLLPHESGSFYINDGSINKINKETYRSQVGLILQRETPFDGTILENITFGNTYNDSDLKWALDSVGLTPYIKTLPEGLDTHLYPEGRQLSASNAQKVMLARVIISRPNVLLLEDPTDKIDTETARKIIDFLMSPQNKWTVIVSSVNSYWENSCNRQIVMENGEIVEDKKI